MGKSKRVVVLGYNCVCFYLLSIVVLEVLDISPTSEPLLFLILFSFITEHQHFHAIIIQRVTFTQVEHVELHSHVLGSIGNFEIEPLSMPISIDVILQY